MSAELPFGTSVGDWRITIPVDGVIEITHNGGNVLRLPSGRSSVTRDEASKIKFSTDADASLKLIVSRDSVALMKDRNVIGLIGDFDEDNLYILLNENFPVSILAAAANPVVIAENGDPSAGGRRRRNSSRRNTRRTRKQ